MIEEKDDDDDDKPKLSKKKLKKLNRLSVAELKQLVSRPDVVEMHDVTARDPKLLVHLKSTRNTVPVPRHWCFKRKYLQVWFDVTLPLRTDSISSRHFINPFATFSLVEDNM